jgi:FixJ family two-component response regulator
MLTNVVRLLRQFNYESLVFPSAEAFASHRGFDSAACILLDIDLGDGSGIELRQASQSSKHSKARDITVVTTDESYAAAGPPNAIEGNEVCDIT